MTRKANDINYPLQIQNAQPVRLLDVFIIAPFLIFVALKFDLPVWVKYTLITIGIGTFLYNGFFYLKYKQ